MNTKELKVEHNLLTNFFIKDDNVVFKSIVITDDQYRGEVLHQNGQSTGFYHGALTSIMLSLSEFLSIEKPTTDEQRDAMLDYHCDFTISFVGVSTNTFHAGLESILYKLGSVALNLKKQEKDFVIEHLINRKFHHKKGLVCMDERIQIVNLIYQLTTLFKSVSFGVCILGLDHPIVDNLVKEGLFAK